MGTLPIDFQLQLLIKDATPSPPPVPPFFKLATPSTANRTLRQTASSCSSCSPFHCPLPLLLQPAFPLCRPSRCPSSLTRRCNACCSGSRADSKPIPDGNPSQWADWTKSRSQLTMTHMPRSSGGGWVAIKSKSMSLPVTVAAIVAMVLLLQRWC